MLQSVIFSIMQLFGVFSIGWAARYWNYIREEDLQRWSKFIVDLLFPCFGFAILTQNLNRPELLRLWPLPILGFGMIAFGAICGMFLKSLLKKQTEANRKTFVHLCAVNNFGFLPIIIIGNLWGDEAVAFLFLLNFTACFILT